MASYTPTDGFDSNYAELLAEISLKQGDEAAARDYYQTAIDTLPTDQAEYARVLTLKLDRLPVAEEISAESNLTPIDAVDASSESGS